MSQTETVMVLALGSALTFVFFLLFGRVFWNMASSAGSRRRNKLMPVEMLELQADRDRLRAEHALMARKLDLRLDDIKLRMAEQMAEVSRNRNRVQTLLLDLETKNDALKIKDQEVGSIQTQLELAQTELQAARQTIENMANDGSRRDTEIARLQDDFRRLNMSLRDKNSLISSLNDELRHALIPTSNGIVAAPKEDADSRLRMRVAELTSLAADMSDGRNSSINRTANLQFSMDETDHHSQEMDQELLAMEKLLDRNDEAVIQPEEPVKKSGPVANVISLAQRIRALQHSVNE
jgi:chromosome segregation ATPase